MSDRNTGDFEGLPPDEATDPDEQPHEEDADPPEEWVAADRWGTTSREQREGEPLSLRLIPISTVITTAWSRPRSSSSRSRTASGRSP